MCSEISNEVQLDGFVESTYEMTDVKAGKTETLQAKSVVLYEWTSLGRELNRGKRWDDQDKKQRRRQASVMTFPVIKPTWVRSLKNSQGNEVT